MKRAVALVLAAQCGCTAPERGVEAFAADPEAAKAVIAACDAGRARRDCETARRGLAEAQRRDRLAVYARTAQGG